MENMIVYCNIVTLATLLYTFYTLATSIRFHHELCCESKRPE